MFQFLSRLFHRSAPSDEAATQAVLDLVTSLAQPTILMEPAEDAMDGPTSTLRLGGLPRLSAGTPWPTRDGRSLAFLGELNLASVRQAGGPDWLPGGGVLHIFYDAREAPWGFDPKDRGGCIVLFTPAADDNERAPPADLDGKLVFRSHILQGRSVLSYPDLDRLTLPEEVARNHDSETLYELETRQFGEGPQHRIGGYPSPIQNDEMERECQLASNGVYLGDAKGYASEQAVALLREPVSWKLLLQIDSDEAAGMMWGDMGRLYIWVPEHDARQGDFTNVWLILQST